MRWLWISALLGACAGGPAPACDQLCNELYYQCSYEAYPSFDSCRQGCSWQASEGVDISGYNACVQDAACDTFAILECERDYGLE